jgi:hypothetical protein
MQHADAEALARAASHALHHMVEAEIVEIIPARRDRCAGNADDADIGNRHAEGERAERRDQGKTNDFKADGVTNTVGCGSHE